MKGLPLNVMYWVHNEDDTYEVLDGQQRTISICEFASGRFSVNFQYFHNIDEEVKQKFLDYELMIYVCQGTDTEKLEWFRTINIAGEKLTEQELRNAVYSGQWLTDAKKYFSKPNCPAYDLGKDYMSGSPIRQDYLETVLDWISQGEIEQYMANKQKQPNASDLWLYYQNLINWVKVNFPNYRKEMKGLNWDEIYQFANGGTIDADLYEQKIKTLMLDEDVTNKKGIYYYIFSDNPSYLNIRAFTLNQKREAYERQAGICVVCGNHFQLDEMEADHITPWVEGGKTDAHNCQMLCKHDNRKKGKK
jgi:hypothetical protein